MSIATTKADESRGRTTQAFAAGGLAAGLLASSCCLLPLLLLWMGIGGAWIARLTALAPYQPLFLGVATAALGLGFWRTYRRKGCAAGASCESSTRSGTTKALLWLGVVAVFVTVSINLIVPLFP